MIAKSNCVRTKVRRTYGVNEQPFLVDARRPSQDRVERIVMIVYFTSVVDFVLKQRYP